MNQIKTTLFLIGMPLLMILIGEMLAREVGVFIAIILTIFMYISAFTADTALLNLYHTHSATAEEKEKITGIISTLSKKIGMTEPTVYFVQDESPNAFSIGLSESTSKLIVTTGLLKKLNKNELTAVLAHELSIIYYAEISLSTITTAIADFFIGFTNPVNFKKIIDDRLKEPGKINLILIKVFGPIASFFVKLGRSKDNILHADAMAVKLCGESKSLVSAIKKIENAQQEHVFSAAQLLPATSHLFFINPLQKPALLRWFNTQPSPEDRIKVFEGSETKANKSTK